jgi:hypothetical protein
MLLEVPEYPEYLGVLEYLEYPANLGLLLLQALELVEELEFAVD